MKRVCWISLLLLLAAGCASTADEPHFGAATAIQLADAAAIAHGYYLRQYQRVPPPHYNTADSSWWVDYQPRPSSGLSPHTQFSVRVRDVTKETSIVVP
jgi:hypothetical protein